MRSEKEAAAKVWLIEEQARRTAAEAERTEFDTLWRKVCLAIVVAFALVLFVRFLFDPGSIAVGGVGVVAVLGWLAKHASMA